MTWSTGERLYHLLPAVYRLRDAAQGEPLRGTIAGWPTPSPNGGRPWPAPVDDSS